MAVTFTGGSQQSNSTWNSLNTLTQSTATAFQAIDPRFDAVALGMGTASGDNRNNLYSLTATGGAADAVEGHELILFTTGTGEAAVYVEMATGRLPFQLAFMSNGTATTVDALAASATGNWVFGVDGDFMQLKFMNDKWMFMDGQGVTQATAT